MSFTMKCNACGNEQAFEHGSKSRAKNIEIHVDMENDFVGCYIKALDVYCENEQCNKYVALEY